MQKICRQCDKSFQILSAKSDFFEKMGLGRDYQPPKCSDCIRQQLQAFWPFSNFHMVTCDYSGEKTTSVIPAYLDYKIYKRSHWINGDWEPPSLTPDLNKNLFEQFYELKKKAPHFNMLGENIENCDYCDDGWYSKNCYLMRAFAYCEDILYGYRVLRCKDCVDVTFSFDSEKCYDCTYCFKCFNLKYSLKCRGCSDSSFLYDCRNCHDCFMCFNLRNKKYCILNKQYSKEEYEKKLKKIDFGSYNEIQELKNSYQEKLNKHGLYRAIEITNTENSTGNYLEDCKNCMNSFFFQEAEDCFDMFRGLKDKDTADSSGAFNMELSYQTNQCTDCYNLKFSSFCSNCNNSEYLDMCLNCDHCFMCISLINRKYCIFNKQYTEEEYKKLVPQIKQKMKEQGIYGEFLPYNFAYTPYTESLAGYYYPLTEEIEKMGALKEQEEPDQDQMVAIEAAKLPDDIRDVKPVDLKNKVVKCVESGLKYNFIPKEIEFYKKNNVPLPREHSYIRNKKRYDLLYGSFEKREVLCAICGEATATFFPADFPGRIACEKCYLKEVY